MGQGDLGLAPPTAHGSRELEIKNLQEQDESRCASPLSPQVANALAMLNVIHVGCAGFNKILGPWRTEMRTCASAIHAAAAAPAPALNLVRD